MKKFLLYSGSFTLLLLVTGTFVFQNCGSFKAYTRLSSKACAQDMFPVFSSGYHNFFKNQGCVNCHAPGKSKADVPLASSDANQAFAVFQTRGPNVINSKLQTNHNITFSSVASQLNQLKTQWEAALNDTSSCGDGHLTAAVSLPFYVQPLTQEYIDKGYIDFPVAENMRGVKTLSFDLSKSPFSPKLKGGKLDFDIEVLTDTYFKPQMYKITNPRMTTPSASVHIKGLKLLLNEKNYGVTTYEGLDVVVPQTTSGSFAIDTNGAAAMFEKMANENGEDKPIYDNSDKWTVNFDIFEILKSNTTK